MKTPFFNPFIYSLCNRILIVAIFASIFSSFSIDQTPNNLPFYYLNSGEKVYIRPQITKLLVSFQENITDEQKIRILNTVSKNNSVNNTYTKSRFVTTQLEQNIQIDYPDFLQEEQVLKAAEMLRIKKEVAFVSPYYEYDESFTLLCNSIILTELEHGVDLDNLYNLFDRLGVEIASHEIRSDGVEQVKLNTNYKSKANSLEIANTLFETGYFKYCEPGFIVLGNSFQSSPKTSFNDQDDWSIEKTQTDEAWTKLLNKGKTPGGGVVIAILDSGVDLGHNDLNFYRHSNGSINGKDAFSETWSNSQLPSNFCLNIPSTPDIHNYYGGPGASISNYQKGNAHGTNAAGIAAAKKNGTGAIGVAYGSRIMPIRVGHNFNCYLSCSGNTVITSQAVNSGLRYAAENGANIINLSLAMPFSSSVLSAINYAHNIKNCVIVCASGNSSKNLVPFPANQAVTIAVGASTDCDTRKSSCCSTSCGKAADPKGISCDGQNWWGSNYGINLDVIAPGYNLYTTDISGNGGYTSNDYEYFEGTSGSAPFVSGIAALILSANPSLTNLEIREILESTCDKIPSYDYLNRSDQPNGTWNYEVGYGRVNSYQAVLKALGNSYSCSNTINNYPYTQSFEYSSYTTEWRDISTDDLDWIKNSGSTNSDFTGPSNAYAGNSYLYIEATNNYPNKNAVIETPCFNISSLSKPILTFWYHMVGSDMGNLYLDVSTDGGKTWQNSYYEKEGNQYENWQSAIVDLTNIPSYGSEIKFRFWGQTGSNYRSDIAIDNFRIGEPLSICHDPFEPNTSSSGFIIPYTTSNWEWTSPNLCIGIGDTDWIKFYYNSTLYYLMVREYQQNESGPYKLKVKRSGSFFTFETTYADAQISSTDTELFLFPEPNAAWLGHNDDEGEGRFSYFTHNFGNNNSLPNLTRDYDVPAAPNISGNVIGVSLGVKNIGQTVSQSSTIRCYLSLNTSITTQDYEITSRYINDLGPGVSNYGSRWVDVTGIVPPGDYYLGFLVDADHNVSELRETDNDYVWDVLIPIRYFVTLSDCNSGIASINHPNRPIASGNYETSNNIISTGIKGFLTKTLLSA